MLSIANCKIKLSLALHHCNRSTNDRQHMWMLVGKSARGRKRQRGERQTKERETK